MQNAFPNCQTFCTNKNFFYVLLLNDDGDIDPESIKKRKYPPTLPIRKHLRGRWLKFHQNQLHIVIDCSYDLKEETTIDVGPNPSITYDVFMKLFVRRLVSYFN